MGDKVKCPENAALWSEILIKMKTKRQALSRSLPLKVFLRGKGSFRLVHSLVIFLYSIFALFIETRLLQTKVNSRQFILLTLSKIT